MAEDDAAAQRRVAMLRHKLTKAMDDPLMRDQIVKAIRSMMIEDSKGISLTKPAPLC